MTRIGIGLAVGLAVLGMGAEMVPTPGSRVTYPSQVEYPANGRSVGLVLTGTALRTRLAFNVYAIGSYAQTGVSLKTAEDLVAAQCLKRLHLVMERDVSGRDMAEAFRAAVRLNHPDPAFANEIADLVRFMEGQTCQRGDHVFLTFLPGTGLHVQVVGRGECTIRGDGFARAVWEIYLGQRNIGDAIKRGLVSRL